MQFDPMIQENVYKLCRKLEQHVGTNTAANLSHEYRVLTSDTITGYIGLGSAPLLDNEDLGKSYREYGRIVTETAVLIRHFPYLAFFRHIPPIFLSALSPSFTVLKKHLDVSSQFRNIRATC